MYFEGADQQIRYSILSLLRYEVGELPFKYLFSIKRLSMQQYKSLVEKITSKITNWMAKGLSYKSLVEKITSKITNWMAKGMSSK